MNLGIYISLVAVCYLSKLPGTKVQTKYLGPFEVEKVTKSHVIVTNKLKKPKKVPFHLTKKYLQPNVQVIILQSNLEDLNHILLLMTTFYRLRKLQLA